MPDKLGRMIGWGKEAEIYAWGEDQVIKLFFESTSLIQVEAEEKAARVAYEAGVPTPMVGEIVEVDHRWGVVLQRFDGPSMLVKLVTHPWQLRWLACQLAELQAAVHDCKALSLPSVKNDIREWVEGVDADAGLKQTVLQRVNQLPEGDRLCHGDLYPDNVIMSSQGPVVIDWSHGQQGDPLADVGRTWVAMRIAIIPEFMKGRHLLTVLRAAFYSFFLRRYRELRPFTDEQLAAWKVPMIALRAARDDILPEELQRVMNYLERALGKKTTG